MESILVLMNDDALTGKINTATKTVISNDILPVLKPWNTVLYNDGWSGVTVASMPKISLSTVSAPGNHNCQSDTYNKIYKLLDQGKFRKGLSRERSEEAMALIETYNILGFETVCRGLVYFPDLLQRYLRIHPKVSDDDLGAMIARCIQHRSDDVFHLESIEYLIKYHASFAKSLEIKLLPLKYPIDIELYNMVREHKIYDSYYDSAMTGHLNNISYTYSDLVVKARERYYVGYRDAYHCLLYGSYSHLQSLILYWDIWGDDCTGDAARDFFGLDLGAPIEVIKAKVNNKSHAKI